MNGPKLFNLEMTLINFEPKSLSSKSLQCIFLG
jgi:hypothetical protein